MRRVTIHQSRDVFLLKWSPLPGARFVAVMTGRTRAKAAAKPPAKCPAQVAAETAPGTVLEADSSEDDQPLAGPDGSKCTAIQSRTFRNFLNDLTPDIQRQYQELCKTGGPRIGKQQKNVR